jgi:hypothetical protein
MKITRSKKSRDTVPLKVPKREIFIAGIFTSIKPVWVGDLGTRTKNPKLGWLGPFITLYYLVFFSLALKATALKKQKFVSRPEKSCFRLLLYLLVYFFLAL